MFIVRVIVQGGDLSKRWMNLTDAIKTVKTAKAPRVVKTEVRDDDQETQQVSILKQTVSESKGLSKDDIHDLFH